MRSTWTCSRPWGRAPAPSKTPVETISEIQRELAQGGMADWFTVAANRLHAVPDDLDDHRSDRGSSYTSTSGRSTIEIRGGHGDRTLTIAGESPRKSFRPWRARPASSV